MREHTSRALFAELNKQEYSRYQDLENAVIDVYNKHLRELPPGYSYRRLIELGRQKRWIIEEAGGFRISLD
jgi:hypothetical protein